MKEKSSSLFAEQASGGGSPSVPSVDSRSVLERSTLVLRWSLEPSCWSPAEVASVWEDNEDKRLLEGCFRAEVALLSGDGDSGAKLQERKESSLFQVKGGSRKQGAGVLYTPGNKSRTSQQEDHFGYSQALFVVLLNTWTGTEWEKPVLSHSRPSDAALPNMGAAGHMGLLSPCNVVSINDTLDFQL